MDVAELEQRKYALMDFVNKTESYWRNPNVSDIQADGTVQGGDGGYADTHTVGQQTSSTPAQGRRQDVRSDSSQQGAVQGE